MAVSTGVPEQLPPLGNNHALSTKSPGAGKVVQTGSVAMFKPRLICIWTRASNEVPGSSERPGRHNFWPCGVPRELTVKTKEERSIGFHLPTSRI